ncbi:MAG: PIG-L family deacetylase [Terracidiphilus sp.]|nr:PIG-L family deacetylase [Terracidiphilus sp.]
MLAARAAAQSPTAAPSPAPPLLPPDDRYKADLLLIVAHPDDDVMVGGYLARLVLDQHKRVAVIYTTSGDGGGNAVGNEAGPALGQVRILEARHALGSLGIENVWFLGFHDTPGQNPLRSLDHWNHGLALDEIVRLVRLTRPPVILTWLPCSVAGENHGDHQASGILATEAFDAAADPTRFPEQISPPRDRTGMNNLTEGLLPWQPQKLYFFSDAFEVFSPYWHDPAVLPTFRKSLIDGAGPSYDTTTVSPSRHVSYAQLEAGQQAFYSTQEGALGDQAIATKNFKDFEYPIPLILGKTIVPASATGDVFEGVSPSPVRFAPAQGFGLHPDPPDSLRFRIGDPWSFYTQFWFAHNLQQLVGAMPEPELGAGFGDKLSIPIQACNDLSDPVEFAVTSALPAGWTDQTPFTRYPVRPGECYPILAQVSSPASGGKGWRQLTWTATAGQRRMTAQLRVYMGGSGGLPQ